MDQEKEGLLDKAKNSDSLAFIMLIESLREPLIDDAVGRGIQFHDAGNLFAYARTTKNSIIISGKRREAIQQQKIGHSLPLNYNLVSYTNKHGNGSAESHAVAAELKETIFASVDPRDHPILELLMEGYIPKEVTQILNDQGQDISLATVTKRIQRIRTKLGHMLPNNSENGSSR